MKERSHSSQEESSELYKCLMALQILDLQQPLTSRYPLSTILFITVAYKKKQDEQDRRRHDDQDDEPFCIPIFSFGSSLANLLQSFP